MFGPTNGVPTTVTPRSTRTVAAHKLIEKSGDGGILPDCSYMKIPDTEHDQTCRLSQLEAKGESLNLKEQKLAGESVVALLQNYSDEEGFYAVTEA